MKNTSKVGYSNQSSVNMKSGSTSFVIKEVLIKTTMTKPRLGRIWSEEAAYLVLANVNQYNHLGNRLYTLRLRAHALWPSGSTLGINSLEASAQIHQETRMLTTILLQSSNYSWNQPQVHEEEKGQAQGYTDTMYNTTLLSTGKKRPTIIYHNMEEPHRHNKQKKPDTKADIWNDSLYEIQNH